MIRYIIEKTVNDAYVSGVVTVMDGDKPRTFTSPKEAINWLMDNDEEYRSLPIVHLVNHYNIKPYVI